MRPVGFPKRGRIGRDGNVRFVLIQIASRIGNLIFHRSFSLQDSSMPYLAFNLNNGNGFIFDLVEERLTRGRNAGNDVVIENSFISQFHAEFLRQPDGAYVLLV